MKYVLTGPRSSGKSTVGKLLAPKLKVDYISSDDEMDLLLKEHGGIDGATKAGKKELLGKTAKQYITDVATKNNYLLDLAGGALRPYYNKYFQLLKKQAKIISIIPSTDTTKTIDILYARERQRPHFNNLTDEELLAKTKKDYEKIREQLQTECDILIITENKTPQEIVTEILQALKLVNDKSLA